MIWHLMTKWSNILGDFRLHFLQRNWLSCCWHLTHSQSQCYRVIVCTGSGCALIYYSSSTWRKTATLTTVACFLLLPLSWRSYKKYRLSLQDICHQIIMNLLFNQHYGNEGWKEKEKIEEFTVAYSNDRFERLSKFDSFWCVGCQP